MGTFWGRCDAPGVHQIYYRPSDGKVANRECCITRRSAHMVLVTSVPFYEQAGGDVVYAADLANHVAKMASTEIEEYYLSLVWMAPPLGAVPPFTQIRNGPLPPQCTEWGDGVIGSGEYQPPTEAEMLAIFNAELDFVVDPDIPNSLDRFSAFYTSGALGGEPAWLTPFLDNLQIAYPDLQIFSQQMPFFSTESNRWLFYTAASLDADV